MQENKDNKLELRECHATGGTKNASTDKQQTDKLITIGWSNGINHEQVYGSYFTVSAVRRSLLTLNMLNYFKDYKRYIHILNCILDSAWPK